MNIKEIITRFNDAVYELTRLIIAERNNDEEATNRHTENASRALYETFEWALKKHILDYGSPDQMRNARNGNSDRKRLLFDFQNMKNPINDEIQDNIDYSFLMDGGTQINKGKHRGDRPNPEMLKQFYGELYKLLDLYIDVDSLIKKIEDYESINIPGWDELYSICNKFVSSEQNYILVIGKSKDSYFDKLRILPWSLVIDFDYNSRKDGFYQLAYEAYKENPSIINVGDNVDSETFATYYTQHYHYFINSYRNSGVDKPLDYDIWQRNYENGFDKLIELFAQKFNFNTKLIFISDNVGDEYCEHIGKSFRKHFGDRIDIIFAMKDAANYEIPIKRLKAKHVSTSILDIVEGITNFSSNFTKDNLYTDQYIIPYNEDSGNKDASGVLSIDEFIKLETDFTVLHRGLDTEIPDKSEDKREFLCGEKKISWFGLRNDWDAKHRSLKGGKGYLETIRKALRNASGKLNLIHEAGYGGTTVARRIAWDLHNDYPTLILKEYRGISTIQKIVSLYDKTRKTIFVILEVPQGITLDDAHHFYLSVNSTGRPAVFLIVRRGLISDQTDKKFYLTDWGNNTYDLVQSYKPYLDEYKLPVVKNKKEEELNEIISSFEGYKKTPFYVGLLTFEEKFIAVKSYIKGFVNDIKTEEQKRIILYLSICHDYLGEKLPASFFHNVLNISLDRVINLIDYLDPSFMPLLASYQEGKHKFWQIRHALFSRELKKQILAGNDDISVDLWKENLANCCIRFIEDSVVLGQNSSYIETLLQNLFIGTYKDREGKAFTPIVDDIKNNDDKERVFNTLMESYPENPHFCSHLARFYSYYQKNTDKALYFADKAIYLSESMGRKDDLLYHIKGMCIREIAYSLMEEQEYAKKNNDVIQEAKTREILDILVPQAEYQFNLCREIAKELRKVSEHGYIAHIQLLIRVINFGQIMSNISKDKFLAQNKDPFAYWLDIAENLLEEVKRISIDEVETTRVNDSSLKLAELYGDYSQMLQILNNQLEKGNNPIRTKRQLVRVLFNKEGKDIKMNYNVIVRVMSLMEDNIEAEPSNEKNFYLWFQAARFSNVKLKAAMTKLSRWNSHSSVIDSIYYFYILKVFGAIEGYTDDAVQAFKLIEQCKKSAPKSQNLKTCYEWYGNGEELTRLVSRKALNLENKDIKLSFVEGYFTKYNHPGSGVITICDKLEVFFSPIITKLTRDNLNQKVKFYLGFSYDGLRADNYSVVLVE
ncbi:MAG: hypothetical protein ACI81I_000632 [Arcobacteraceae bacterium]|jgi:hypothetical protein